MNTAIQTSKHNIIPDYFEYQNVSAAPSKQSNLTVLFCRSGNAMLFINDSEFAIEQGQMCILLQGVFVSVREKTDDFYLREAVLPERLFGESLMNVSNVASELATISRSPVLRLNDQEQESLVQLMDLCRNLGYPCGRYGKKCIDNIYVSLIYFICQIAQREHTEQESPVYEGSQRHYQYFLEFLSLLSANCCSQRNVKFYADKLYITPKYLSAILKSVSDKTANTWIDEFVISEAKQLIKYSGKSISEISYQLNFQNPSHFGKYFRRITGLTPARYRADNLR